MALFPEKEPTLPVSEIPETPEIPEYIERAGVATRPTQFTAKVTDDRGNPMVQPPTGQNISVQIPSDQTTLLAQSKGSVSDSVTWLAAFWLRLIKKALHFGWKIIGGANAANS